MLSTEQKSPAIMIQFHCPCCIAFIALSRLFAFVWIVHRHPSHRILALCFHSLVFVDVQAAHCSSRILSGVVSADIHKYIQNMLNIKCMLFIQDIEASCYSHGTRATKFNACQRTISQHRANAATRVYELGFLKLKARVCTTKNSLSRSLLWFLPLKFRYALPAKLGWPITLSTVATGPM